MEENMKENARVLNETINKTRDMANQLTTQYNCGYSDAFAVAMEQEGIVNFSEIVKVNQKSNEKVRVLTKANDLRNIA